LLTSSGRLESYRFSVGFAHSKGCRDEMEDVLTIETNFMNDERNDLFLVLDGHCGIKAAKMVGHEFHKILQEKIELTKNASDIEIMNKAEELQVEVEPNDIEPELMKTVIALHLAFDEVKEKLRRCLDCEEGGTTALVCLVLDTTLFICNVGDTRAVMVKRGGEVEQLSKDHRPIDSERDRIIQSGGTVLNVSVPRVEGVLAVSRALGNFDLETKGVISKPFTRVIPNFLDGAWFLIMASDGLWDCVSANVASEICDDVFYQPHDENESSDYFLISPEDDDKKPHLKRNESKITKFQNELATLAAQKLANEAWRKHSTDNIAIIVINFDPNNT